MWLIPALVVLGDFGYLLWLMQYRPGLSGLGALLLFLFLIVPGSVMFLAVYAATIRHLRSSSRQRGTLLVLGLSVLAGLGACAIALGLLLSAFLIELKLTLG